MPSTKNLALIVSKLIKDRGVCYFENPFQEILSLHGNNLHALAAMDSGSSEPPRHFRFLDIFKIPVLHPFLVILVLMFILQFCGQGVITFYTVQIFKVDMTRRKVIDLQL